MMALRTWMARRMEIGCLAALMLVGRAMAGSSTEEAVGAIGGVLDRFYETAAAADYDGYFALFAENGLFLGTDATERWTVTEFREFVRPHFAAGRGWAYEPGERHVVLSPEGRYAWFDEALTSQAYGPCRGSGVMQWTDAGWKIAQYHLTIPIPNDLAKEVVKLIEEQTPTPTPTVSVRRLADGVWVHLAEHETEEWGVVSANGLIVEEGDRLIVIDTAWGAENSRELLAWITREWRRPVTDLIVTHFHTDSFGGWQVFAEQGATIWATRQTLALSNEEPTAAFNVLDLAVGERKTVRSVELLYPGPAHAPDNVVVWVPQAAVLFGGCAVRSAEAAGLGNTGDAVIAQWADSMRRVQAAFPTATQVVPGHGASGGPDLLEHTIALVEAAQQARK